MGKKKSKGPRQEDVTQEVARAISETMARESDRGCLLVGCGALELALGWAIRNRFKSLSPSITEEELKALLDVQPMPPIGSFAVRIRVAFALGVIDRPTHEALGVIRRFRNAGAHLTEPVRYDTEDWTNCRPLLSPLERAAFDQAFPRFENANEAYRALFQAVVAKLWVNLFLFAEVATEALHEFLKKYHAHQEQSKDEKYTPTRDLSYLFLGRPSE